jgi:hypothetical protein
MLDLDNLSLSIRSYFENKEKERILYASQVDRFYKKNKDNMSIIIEKIITKYDSDKYILKEYKLGYQPREELYWVLLSIAKQYGTKIEINEENTEKYSRLNMFTSVAYIFEGYLIQKMDGQGSVVRIYKI